MVNNDVGREGEDLISIGIEVQTEGAEGIYLFKRLT